MEWNDYENWTRGNEVRAACDAEDLVFTIWLTRDFSGAQARQAAIESECVGILLEGEIPAESAPGVPNPQAVNWADVAFYLSDLPIYKGVVTNMAPFTHHDGTPYPEKAKPLIDAGWSCHTECYDMTGNPATWPEERAFFAKHLGWNTTQPALGAYGGRTVESFPTRNDYRNWSAWAAEYVL
jgi:hypothetical protein